MRGSGIPGEKEFLIKGQVSRKIEKNKEKRKNYNKEWKNKKI